MQFGINPINDCIIEADPMQVGMLICVGSTGAGKTVTVLFLLYKLFVYALTEHKELDLYICDFKKSGDYRGLTDKFAEYDEVTNMIESFYEHFCHAEENNPNISILLIDELAGYLNWLGQQDSRKAKTIRGYLGSILSLGRSRHYYVWSVLQRVSSSLFPPGSGAIDNYQINIGMGRLTVESRKSLFAGEHFDDEEFEENYHPKTGQGLILIDGQELQPIQIPYIKDKEKLKALLRKLAKECLRT